MRKSRKRVSRKRVSRKRVSRKRVSPFRAQRPVLSRKRVSHKRVSRKRVSRISSKRRRVPEARKRLSYRMSREEDDVVCRPSCNICLDFADQNEGGSLIETCKLKGSCIQHERCLKKYHRMGGGIFDTPGVSGIIKCPTCRGYTDLSRLKSFTDPKITGTTRHLFKHRKPYTSNPQKIELICYYSPKIYSAKHINDIFPMYFAGGSIYPSRRDIDKMIQQQKKILYLLRHMGTNIDTYRTIYPYHSQSDRYGNIINDTYYKYIIEETTESVKRMGQLGMVLERRMREEMIEKLQNYDPHSLSIILLDVYPSIQTTRIRQEELYEQLLQVRNDIINLLKFITNIDKHIEKTSTIYGSLTSFSPFYTAGGPYF